MYNSYAKIIFLYLIDHISKAKATRSKNLVKFVNIDENTKMRHLLSET